MFLKNVIIMEAYSVSQEGKKYYFAQIFYKKIDEYIDKNFCMSLTSIWKTCRYFSIKKKWLW